MAQSPLLGFNNNVRHKGRVFHIQTEDSGIRHPHIITHLFADGGRILKTTKTSYAEHVGETGISETVRAMMKEQHKGMFIALRDGQLDHLLGDISPDRASNPGPISPPVKPPPVSAPAASAPVESAPVASAPIEEAPRAAPALDDKAMGPHSRPIDPLAAVARSAPPRDATVVVIDHGADAALAATEPPPEGDSEAAAIADEPTEDAERPKRHTSRPRLEINTAGLHRGGASPHAPTVEIERVIEEPSIDLDLDALERAAVEAQNPVVLRQHDLPPPPAAVLGKKNPTKPVGGYSVTTSAGAADPLRGLSTPQQGTPKPAGNNALPAGAGRYAPSRPAAIFANSRPQDGASIFGEDLISEKSLDEVILSYLAEDLDGPGDKK